MSAVIGGMDTRCMPTDSDLANFTAWSGVLELPPGLTAFTM